MQRTESGFSIIELMIVLAIAGILVAMAAPSFRSSMRDTAMGNMQSGLNMALKLARSEAVAGTPRTRGYTVDTVHVCPSSNGTGCSSDWADGWIVYIPSTAAGSSPALVLRYFRGDATFTVTGSSSNIMFTPLGFPTSDGSAVISPSFTFEDEQDMVPDKTLTMKSTGSITVTNQ